MARHLRLEYEGAIYHITSRGNERSNVFQEDYDKKRFQEKLAAAVEQHGVRLYAYVIMTNHYHLLLETPRGNLSRFMQQFNTSYTMYYNVKHNRVGHLFSGRYKAKVVNGDEYLLTLTRYIHLNPVKISSVKNLGPAKRINKLSGYQWSSYPGYIGAAKQDKWVDYGPLTELAGQYDRDKRKGYRMFVESGLTEDDEDLKEVLKRSSKAIGGLKFCRNIERQYRAAMKQKKAGTDVAMRRVEVGEDVEELLNRICGAFGVKKEELSRRRCLSDARLAAAILLKDQSDLTGREIGQRLGLADGSGLGNLLKVAERHIAKNRRLRGMMKRLS